MDIVRPPVWIFETYGAPGCGIDYGGAFKQRPTVQRECINIVDPAMIRLDYNEPRNPLGAYYQPPGRRVVGQAPHRNYYDEYREDLIPASSFVFTNENVIEGQGFVLCVYADWRCDVGSEFFTYAPGDQCVNLPGLSSYKVAREGTDCRDA